MGLLDFGTVPETGVKGPYTDYDTALAALRADAGASDGDVYELDSGRLLVAHLTSHASGGILIPSEIDALYTVGNLASNATGDAYWTEDDDWIAAEGRGFDDSGVVAPGTLSGAPGGGVRLASGVNGDARVRFSPTSATGVMLLVARIGAVVGDVPRATGFFNFQGSYQWRLVVSAGSPGAPRLVEAAGTNELAGVKGQLPASVVGEWIFTIIDDSASDALSQVLTTSNASRLVGQRSDLPVTTQDRVQIIADYQDGTAHTVDVGEFFWIHLS